MSESRSLEQRKTDALAILQRNSDLWLATASKSGQPHLIPISTWWDGSRLVMATTGTSRTARNLDATGRGRIAAGSPEDVIMIDVRTAGSVPVTGADGALRSGFVAAVGWDPAEEGDNWRFFLLEPVRVQAYAGYGELEGRDIMRDGRWLG